MDDNVVNTALVCPDAFHAGTVGLMGVPLDENSSYLRGAALAPKAIREAIHSASSNLYAENGIDLGANDGWQDLGDLKLDSGMQALAQIEGAIGQALEQEMRVLSLGGDHSVTYPILRAYARKYPNLTLLHLDAHPDLYEEFEGNPYSHACPFTRIMEAGLVTRLIQVGVRTMTSHQRQQAERFGVEVIEMRHWEPGMDFKIADPLYLSLDMDVLEPALAPGISHYEPGGMTPREVICIIQQTRARLVGADLVEFNPTRDPTGITAMVAAKFVKEILSRMLSD